MENDTIATCHTDGCPAAGEPVPIASTVTDPVTGETTDALAQVFCGVCGQPITDLVAIT